MKDHSPSRPRLPGPLMALGFFLASFVLLWSFYERHPLLYDSDAYYHLAIGRTFAADGFVDQLPQLRYSILEEGFGDKELLFHLALAPFGAMEDPVAGGRLALALFGALLATAVGLLAVRAIGPWGWLLPLWLPFASTELAWRLVRLRPEQLSFLLLLGALWAAGTARHRLLGVLALAYTLSYTAFHVLPGLCVLLFLLYGWLRRDWRPALVLYPMLGCGLGILLHPHFPKNLDIWLVQNVAFFLDKGTLDVGTEIRPNSTDVLLMVNLGWWLGLLLLWRSTRPGDTTPPGLSNQAFALAKREDRRLADAFGLATLVFGFLYLLMSRFSLYALPFATLWLLFEIRARGLRLGGRTRLPGRGHLPVWLAIGLCLLISLPEARRQLDRFGGRTDPGPGKIRLRDRETLATQIPEGARLISPWDQTAIYMLWAPQGRYLNVLEPNFMASRDKAAYLAQREIFEGREPDVPLTALTALDSDHLAYSLVGASRELTERLQSDPRVTTPHRELNVLFRVLPGSNTPFVLDWRPIPLPHRVPLTDPEKIASWPSYPRAADSAARALEGYVDARRITPKLACLGFVHQRQEPEAVTLELEFAPYGRGELWIDGQRRLAIGNDTGAILGRAARLEVHLPAGDHRFEVTTCPPRNEVQHNGFYLLERERKSL